MLGNSNKKYKSIQVSEAIASPLSPKFPVGNSIIHININNTANMYNRADEQIMLIEQKF